MPRRNPKQQGIRRSARAAGRGLLVVPALIAYAAAAPPATAAPAVAHATTGLVAPARPAHAAMVSIVPADGAVLASGPTEVVVTFNERLQPSFAQLVVTSGGVQVPAGAPVVDGAVLRLPLTPPPGAGSYRVAFQVVSADGHPITGESGFTVTGPSAPGPGAVGSGPATTTAPTPVTTTSPPPAGTTAVPSTTGATGGLSPSESSPLPWLVGGGALLVLAAGLGVAAARRGRTPR